MKLYFKRSFAVFLLVLILAPLAQAALVDKIAAIVNNDVVLLSDVERFERTMSLRRELDPLFGFSEDMERGSPSRQKILEFLIQEKLIGQTFKVPDSEVEQEVQTVQRTNNLDREQLVSFLKSKGFDFNEYFELMRTGLSKRNLLDREIRSRVNISDDDVRNYYFNTTMKNSSIPLEYSIQLIAVNFSTYKNQNAAKDAAENALQAIRQGEAFSEVAKRVSDDPSAQQGGELGYLPSDQLADPLRGAIKGLQIGQLSSVIKTPNAFIIVKLLDARSAESDKYVAVKEEIRERLAKEEYKKQLFLWAERSRNNAYVHVN